MRFRLLLLALLIGVLCFDAGGARIKDIDGRRTVSFSTSTVLHIDHCMCFLHELLMNVVTLE